MGFVGGGQLAMMTAQEAQYMNEKIDTQFSINILDPAADCPAHQFADHHIIADFKDERALSRLADISDVVTYEIELGNAEALVELQNRGVKVLPSAQSLKTIQDKLTQKIFLRDRRIPVADFSAARDVEELITAARDFGYPVMLKDRRDAYDGRGNYLCRSREDLVSRFSSLRKGGRTLMLERFVPFHMEVSVIAARGVSNEVATFPVGENIHEENILKMTIMPARVTTEIATNAEEIAWRVMDAFGDVGVFGIEMFVQNGQVLVNEIAPRVHNTGHGTLEKDAFSTSQFQQHLRAVSGMELDDTQIKKPVVMHNVLGGTDSFTGRYYLSGEDQVSRVRGARLHMYGKSEVRPRRKMGHISVVGETAPNGSEEEILGLIERAEYARSLLRFIPVGS